MPKTFVVVADAARAKLFVLERDETQTRLEPILQLTNAERRSRASEQFTEPRPGLRQALPGGGRHGLDDKRDAHLHEYDRRFAIEIVKTLQRHNGTNRVRRLIVSAPPPFLGLLRPAFAPLAREQVEIVFAAKDLTHLGTAATHDHLAARSLLPDRGRAS